jgi:hypothetical protein
MTRLARRLHRRPAGGTGTGFTRTVEAIPAPLPDGVTGYPMTGRTRRAA